MRDEREEEVNENADDKLYLNILASTQSCQFILYVYTRKSEDRSGYVR